MYPWSQTSKSGHGEWVNLTRSDMKKLELFFEEILSISHSRLKLWRRCEMAHHYRYYQRLRKRVAATPLFVGTGIHAMLEAKQVRGDWKPELEAFRAEFNRTLFAEERELLGDLPTIIGDIVEGYF